MKHICKVTDPWDNGNEIMHLEYTTSDKDESWALKLGVEGIEEELLKYCKDNMVGKLIPTPGQPAYFTPKFKMGGAVLSIQLNYPLWSDRTDIGISLASPMTDEEFNTLSESYFDFKLCIEQDMGRADVGNATQMTLGGISNLLYQYFTAPEWECDW